MTIETEVKLLINENDAQRAADAIHKKLNSKYVGAKQLVNQYFDTRSLTLRTWDMGLRIRQVDTHKEQTLKTAGKVVGGLHKRPEFNVDIPFSFIQPQLSLFPSEIWPSDANIQTTQAELLMLFETNFLRKKWYVEFERSEIEVVLDIGKIIANDKESPISEVELELIRGSEEDLLSLSEALSSWLEVKAGSESKAKRGYALLKAS
ncbi:hypothetical protein SOPP22_02580 [Shewanella sp. OPT22]|nr:hypothetical protein SOPP22_02580 [Shewanella sp. OPT22]